MKTIFDACLWATGIIAVLAAIIYTAQFLFRRAARCEQADMAHIIQEELTETREQIRNGVLGDRARAKKARNGDIHKG